VIGDADQHTRLATFDWLTEQRAEYGESISRAVLESFALDGVRMPLVGPSGIWKPAVCELPISVTTVAQGPYHDTFDSSTGVLRYAYRGTDPGHRDNAGLRRAMRERVPLVYFHAVEVGRYVAAYPVFIVRDEPALLTFSMQVDDLVASIAAADTHALAGEDAEPRRAYVTASFRRRIHQAAFRERVIRAYRERCALCRLRHRELLDAAHITPDSEAEGKPTISNGLALCKLHHAAFDRFFFTVRPDYVVEVRRSILEETDGPMLVVGLQQIHGSRIELPKRPSELPDPQRLATRYARFAASS
jgi:putative restriction endonuclease